MIACFILISLYFAPWIIAAIRDHHNRGAIALTNFFFGWTCIGWAIALIWAVTATGPKRV